MTQHTTAARACDSAASPAPPAAAVVDTRNELTRVIEIVQTILTGLVLAFIFRAFAVEPFIIPTGSMADSLLGAHATRTCPACGWEFDFAPLRASSPAGHDFVVPPEVLCPNCQLHLPAGPENTVPKAGDRILVHKWPAVVTGVLRPQRWDVLVFRDPADPDQHYIKRVVGLPGEAVEIIDGDVYIDGHIARKPPTAQRVLWFLVFDQGHVPRSGAESARWPRWSPIDPPAESGCGWSGLDTRVLRYDGLDGVERRITFNGDAAPEYLQDLYAHNRRSTNTFVGDVRLMCEVTFEAGAGYCRLELLRPPDRFVAELRADGLRRLRVEQPERPGRPAVEYVAKARAMSPARPVSVELGHVDRRAYLNVDGTPLLTTTDEDYGADAEALRNRPRDQPVSVSMAACDLKARFRRVRIDRDVHYLCRRGQAVRACAGDPFLLGSGEYFVLGDNSPDSHDGREWTEAGPHLPPDYRPGTVPAGQIVGRAAFVYLPGLLPLDQRGRWFVPDIGRMRFVR